MDAIANTQPAASAEIGKATWPRFVVLELIPVGQSMPVAGEPVWLFMDDGFAIEGFFDSDAAAGLEWKDSCAYPLNYDVPEVDAVEVVAWAAMPDRSVSPASPADDKISAMQAALKDACDLLEGWVLHKCPARYRAEHMQHIAKLRGAGEL